MRNANKKIGIACIAVLCICLCGCASFTTVNRSQGNSGNSGNFFDNFIDGSSGNTGNATSKTYTEIVYQVPDGVSSKVLDEAVKVLTSRAQSYSTGVSVYTQKVNSKAQVKLKIYGSYDEEFARKLASEGNLYFVHQIDSKGMENYSYVATEKEDGTTSFGFQLNKTMQQLYAQGDIIATGADVESAQASKYDDVATGLIVPVLNIHFTDEGAEKFAEATKKAYKLRHSIAIVYDGEIISVPTVSAVITDGNVQVSGLESFEEASEMALAMRKAMPIALEPISVTVY